MSVRNLASAVAAVFGALAVVLAATLIASTARIHTAVEVIARDTRSQAIVNELEVGLLMYQRLSNLYVVTGEGEVDATRRAHASGLRALLTQALAWVGSEEERELLGEASRAIDAYMRERRSMEDAALNIEEIVRSTTPTLQVAQEVLDSLSGLNDLEMSRARSQADRADRLSSVVGFGVSAALLLGLLALVLGVQRFLVQPILALHEGLGRVHTGDTKARVAVGGPREIAEAAERFNEMADMLARQREAQLTSLAAVAHDLRNPLAALSMGLRTLEQEQSETHKRRVRERLERQVERLLRMVGDLLDASRIEAGTLELRREEFDLRDIVDDMLRLYAPTSSDHHLSAELPPAPLVIRGDPDRVEQLLSNLLSNAIKFSPAGGPITVCVRPEGSMAVLSVSDEGIGIPPEARSQIFLPFRRARPELAPGVGLGLSVVRRIAEAHGGTVEVESEPGAGSTFLVRIPLASADEAGGRTGE